MNHPADLTIHDNTPFQLPWSASFWFWWSFYGWVLVGLIISLALVGVAYVSFHRSNGVAKESIKRFNVIYSQFKWYAPVMVSVLLPPCSTTLNSLYLLPPTFIFLFLFFFFFFFHFSSSSSSCSSSPPHLILLSRCSAGWVLLSSTSNGTSTTTLLPRPPPLRAALSLPSLARWGGCQHFATGSPIHTKSAPSGRLISINISPNLCRIISKKKPVTMK